ncbi:MAG: triose-phosphate isomerase [bacterium]
MGFVERIQPALDAAAGGAEAVICAPFTALAVLGKLLRGRVALGAQDCFWETEGAFTGEVSPRMLVDAGCRYVIVGHSERRRHFGETDETVRRKIGAAVAAGLTVIACVGERLEERDGGRTMAVVEKQVRDGLGGLGARERERLVVAYEPVWAIGTGRTATPEQAQEVHAFIRRLLADLYGAPTADGTRILYGGSVKPDNIKALMAQKDVDGGLVGGASLDPEAFLRLVNFDRG